MKKIILTSLFCSAFTLFSQAQSQSNEPGFVHIEYDSGIKDLQEKYNNQHKKISGYRIQIFNGSKASCETNRSRYLSIFGDQKVHTVYESPEYKVQVGDFRTKLEAEKYHQQLLEDFSGSFVIKTNIEYPNN